MKKHFGFTLIELLLSLTLSMVILTVSMSLMVFVIHNIKTQFAFFLVEDNVRTFYMMMRKIIVLPVSPDNDPMTKAGSDGFRVGETHYFISSTQRKHPDGSWISALYESSPDRKRELIDNIEDMQVDYVINDGKNIKTIRSNEFKSNFKIMAISIHYQVTSDENKPHQAGYFFKVFP